MNKALLQVLLQEQRQYRGEVSMFDSHFFRVLLTYVTALIAAFGWLASQVIERAGDIVNRSATGENEDAVTLSQALFQVFSELARGPFYYLFTAVPMITALMFLFVARDWTSLHERFNLLQFTSGQLASLVEDGIYPASHLLRLDRGYHTTISRVRAVVEATLLILWVAAVGTISVMILIKMRHYAEPGVRLFWWAAGCVGVTVGFMGLLGPALLFLTRSYKHEKPLAALEAASAITPATAPLVGKVAMEEDPNS